MNEANKISQFPQPIKRDSLTPNVVITTFESQAGNGGLDTFGNFRNLSSSRRSSRTPSPDTPSMGASPVRESVRKWSAEEVRQRRASYSSRVLINLNAQDTEGRTALHYASMLGYDEIVKLLIDAGAVTEIYDNVSLSAQFVIKYPHTRETKNIALINYGCKIFYALKNDKHFSPVQIKFKIYSILTSFYRIFFTNVSNSTGKKNKIKCVTTFYVFHRFNDLLKLKLNSMYNFQLN